MENESRSDRARGALVGLGVGDALGAPLEFTRRDEKPPVTQMQGGGPFGLPAGYWTDDTSMALCLGESLLASGFDLDDQLSRYLQWMEHGHLSSTGTCFDIGIQTRHALGAYRQTGQTLSTGDPNSSGNGTIMRLAPVPIAYWKDVAEAAEKSKEQSFTTHASPEAAEACFVLGAMMATAIQGATKNEILDVGEQLGPGLRSEALRRVFAGSYKVKSRDQISSSGYVVSTLEAALWAFFKTETFEDALVLAVNLGDDSDTVGAVCGELAGAHYGERGIPETWLTPLHDREMIEEMADSLFDLGATETR